MGWMNKGIATLGFIPARAPQRPEKGGNEDRVQSCLISFMQDAVELVAWRGLGIGTSLTRGVHRQRVREGDA
jgi:hypothetical protein